MTGTKLAELYQKSKELFAELTKLLDTQHQTKHTPETWAMFTHLKYAVHGTQETVSELEYTQRYAKELVPV